MKVLIKEKAKIWINGKEFSFDAGMQDIEDDKARILIEAGYAEKVEEKKVEEKIEEPEKPKKGKA